MAFLVAVSFLALCLMEFCWRLPLQADDFAAGDIQSWLYDDSDESSDSPLEFFITRERSSICLGLKTCTREERGLSSELYPSFNYLSRAPPV
jgi:hypothetical protein